MTDERTEKMGYLKITLLADNHINTFGRNIRVRFTHKLLSCRRLENNFAGISEISLPDKSLSVDKISVKFKSQRDILPLVLTLLLQEVL